MAFKNWQQILSPSSYLYLGTKTPSWNLSGLHIRNNHKMEIQIEYTTLELTAYLCKTVWRQSSNPPGERKDASPFDRASGRGPWAFREWNAYGSRQCARSSVPSPCLSKSTLDQQKQTNIAYQGCRRRKELPTFELHVATPRCHEFSVLLGCNGLTVTIKFTFSEPVQCPMSLSLHFYYLFRL